MSLTNSASAAAFAWPNGMTQEGYYTSQDIANRCKGVGHTSTRFEITVYTGLP